MGFQRNVYRIDKLGWDLDTMGMMGMLRGNICREGGVRLWVGVWSDE